MRMHTDSLDDSVDVVVPAELEPGIRSGPITLVIAGMLAGILTWGAIERYYTYGHVPDELVQRLNTHRDEENFRLANRAWYWSGVRHAGLLVGGFGMLLAGTFVLGEWANMPSRRRLATALAIGVGSGLVLGIVGGALAQILYRALKDRSNDPMYKTILVHITAWLPVAFAAGIGLGNLANDRVVTIKATVGAMAGALLAAMLYSPLAGLVFPTLCSELLVPFGTGNRLLWMLLTGSLIGLCGGLAGRHACQQRR